MRYGGHSVWLGVLPIVGAVEMLAAGAEKQAQERSSGYPPLIRLLLVNPATGTCSGSERVHCSEISPVAAALPPVVPPSSKFAHSTSGTLNTTFDSPPPTKLGSPLLHDCLLVTSHPEPTSNNWSAIHMAVSDLRRAHAHTRDAVHGWRRQLLASWWAWLTAMRFHAMPMIRTETN